METRLHTIIEYSSLVARIVNIPPAAHHTTTSSNQIMIAVLRELLNKEVWTGGFAGSILISEGDNLRKWSAGKCIALWEYFVSYAQLSVGQAEGTLTWVRIPTVHSKLNAHNVLEIVKENIVRKVSILVSLQV